MKAVSVANACLAGGGDRLAWGAGLFALGGFADGVGLTEALSAVVPPKGERVPVHDRGVVLVHGLLMTAGGGEACSDIEHLRAQPELFGDVASDSTLYRTLVGLGAGGAAALLDAAAQVRERLWANADRSGPLVVDIDSTLVEVHSENKQGAAPHYKGGFGFHPMVCSTCDGEPLWIKLRSGNAAANHIEDHLEVLDAAVATLPSADAAGHRRGDGAGLVERSLVVRIDAAGCSPTLAGELAERNIGYVVSARASPVVTAAIRSALGDPSRWHTANSGSKRRHKPVRAQVADLTDLADLSGRPPRTRLVVRREPRHPGAQRSLFESENFRYWGFLTDQPGHPTRLDRLMRKHADAEDAIARLNHSGLARMPFTDWHANSTRAALCALSLMLVGWFQNACLTGPLRRATPKRLRRQLWHLPAAVCRSARRVLLRLPDQHPGAKALLAIAHPR
ncbi:IS1380 family transposase [Candidatus Poriferisodalis sp.]|uniref:IS1380 family transposase n=1 Tax=Candidatus Poriferisodalis sp. TaxID=3101277 RepID=UPI003B01D2C4